MSRLKDLLFKKTQELKGQRDKEKIVLAEIEGGQKSLKNLKSRLRKLDADLLKQQGLIYDQVNVNVFSYCDCFLSLLIARCLNSVICNGFPFWKCYAVSFEVCIISVSRCTDENEITETCQSVTYILYLSVSLFFLDQLLFPLIPKIHSLL